MGIYFADDIALAVASEDPVVLAKAAMAVARAVREGLLTTGFPLCVPKSFNSAVPPGGMTGRVFRRVDGISSAAMREMPKNDGLIGK